MAERELRRILERSLADRQQSLDFGIMLPRCCCLSQLLLQAADLVVRAGGVRGFHTPSQQWITVLSWGVGAIWYPVGETYSDRASFETTESEARPDCRSHRGRLPKSAYLKVAPFHIDREGVERRLIDWTQ